MTPVPAQAAEWSRAGKQTQILDLAQPNCIPSLRPSGRPLGLSIGSALLAPIQQCHHVVYVSPWDAGEPTRLARWIAHDLVPVCSQSWCAGRSGSEKLRCPVLALEATKAVLHLRIAVASQMYFQHQET